MSGSSSRIIRNPVAHERLVVDQDHPDRAAHAPTAGSGSMRQAGVDPEARRRRAGLELAAEERDALAHPDQAATAAAGLAEVALARPALVGHLDLDAPGVRRPGGRGRERRGRA